MSTRRPFTLVALGAVLLAGGLATVPSASADTAGPRLTISGTLVRIAPDQARGTAAVRPTWAVQLAGGDLVPVATSFARPPAPHSRFRGTVAVPAPVRRVLVSRGQAPRSTTYAATGTTGRRVLALAGSRALALPVVTSTVSAPAAQAAPAVTAHKVYIAKPTNLGSGTATDADLLDTASAVADYWRAQSEGTAVQTVPTTVKSYATSAAGAQTACGLDGGAAFTNLVNEARRQITAYRPNTSDQLVIEVPTRCSDAGALGLGTVGSTFASGGYLVATSDPTLREGTLAHEMGHNYGFAHANVDCTSDGCDGNYAGIYDVMGAGLSDVNQLTALGTPYRVANAITRTGEIATGTTATLAPRSDTTGVRSLRLEDPTDGSTYYVDYRSGTGTDAGAAYTENLRLQGLPYLYRTGVVVQRPYDDGGATGTEYRSNGSTLAFRAGQFWTSPSGGLAVHVDSISATAAQVSAVGPVTVTPTVRTGQPTRLTTGTWPTGTTFAYRWTLDGTTVSTASSWTPPRSAQGHRLQVAVTGRSGSTSATVTSTAVEVSPPLVRLPRL
ncbi:hypothetical protein GCM10011519_03630 [Marmoricola endophyticus]|uniref:Metallo-peptidase family M12B Reprolysin-like n=1 Tax=Marmoricola endophyticus TaxID=2040280 RepID=A0A917B9W6_9ACTN|nr:hypothetical protein [Marmoricola endophyticus]GGF33469.1 hypothetical protein GCM10011519_03630 [Marmoricola endophyticus]